MALFLSINLFWILLSFLICLWIPSTLYLFVVFFGFLFLLPQNMTLTEGVSLWQYGSPSTVFLAEYLHHSFCVFLCRWLLSLSSPGFYSNLESAISIFTWTFWPYFASLWNLTWLILNYPSLLTLASMISLFLFFHTPLHAVLIVTFNGFLSSSHLVCRQTL